MRTTVKYAFLFGLIIELFLIVTYLYAVQKNPFELHLKFSDGWSRSEPRVDNVYPCGTPAVDDGTIRKLIKAVKLTRKAKLYSRGTKASDILSKSLEIFDLIFVELKYNVTNISRWETAQPSSVCPEEYKGAQFGYPLYQTGFAVQNCPHGQQLSKLITIILDPMIFLQRENVQGQLNKISDFSSKVGSNMTIIAPFGHRAVLRNYANIQFVHVGNMGTGGKWKTMIEKVKTKYVLIAGKVNMLTLDIRLERLIREIESQGVLIAGAATRDQNGHWMHGCKQSAHRNYTITYEDGYFESLRECIYCDHIDGPFVAEKKLFDYVTLNTRLPDTGLFEDFFLRYKARNKESIVCPDSMFFIQSHSHHDLRLWKPFSKWWEIHKLIINSKEMVFPCAVKHCWTSSGESVHPCCAQELSNAVKLIMQLCANAGLFCEFQSGNLLGAVKFAKVLPWEKDADLTFLSANFSALNKLIPAIENAGYSVNISEERILRQMPKIRIFKIFTEHWKVEAFEVNHVDSDVMVANGLKPTKVFFDGSWVICPTNPGLYVRNRYGHEIYRHAEHWLAVKDQGEWSSYDTNTFMNCSRSRSHLCLNQYNNDGSLQFSNPVP